MKLFKELFEGMNQKKQAGMMNKDKLEKSLLDNGFIELGKNGDVIELRSDKKWYLNGTLSKFTNIYQAYRKAYKEGKL